MRSLGIIIVVVVLASCAAFDAADTVGVETDGGRVDGEGGDAGIDGDAAGAPFCGRPGAFCDDFEQGDLYRWQTKVETLSMVSVVQSDGTPPKSGSRQLRVTTNGADAGIRADGFVERTFAPIFPAMLAVRAWLNVSPSADHRMFLSWNLIRSGPGPSAFLATAGGYEGQWGVDLDNVVSHYVHEPAAVAVSTGTWTCVELDLKLATNGHASLFVNDQLIVDADRDTVGDATDVTIGRYAVGVGLRSSEGAIAQTLHFDDVAAIVSADLTVSSQPRIGCK